MAHTYVKKGNRLYHYYACNTRQKQGKAACNTRILPAKEIEDFLVSMLIHIGQDPRLTDRAFRESERLHKAEIEKLTKEKRQLTQEQRASKRRIDNLVATMNSSTTSLSTVAEQLRLTEQLVAQQQQRLAEINAEADRLGHEKVSKEHVVDALTRLESLWGKLTDSERTALLQQLLESVIYDPVNGEILLNFRAGKTGQV